MSVLTNPFDLGIMLIVLVNVLAGWRAGFLATALDLGSWVVMAIVAVRIYAPLGAWLATWLTWPDAYLRLLAFFLLLLLAGLVLGALRQTALTHLQPRGPLRPFDQLFGLLPGLVQGIVVAALLSLMLYALPLSGRLAAYAQQSQLAAPLTSRFSRVVEEATPVLEEALTVTSTLMTVPTEPDETVILPHTVASAPAVPELEARMLMLINQERAAVGLVPLEMDPELTEIARAHSSDMFARGYFSHTTPEGLSPFDRIQAGGVRYLVAGENLAHTATLLTAHEGLMSSPGHRANILNPAFGRVGIGILDGGFYGLMVTQNFRD